MTTLRRLVVTALCSCLVTVLVPAQEHGKAPASKPASVSPAKADPAKAEAAKGDAAKAATVKAPAFVIVKAEGKHEVMSKDALEAKNKMNAEQFAKAMEVYKTQKKAADAAKQKFAGKEPKKITLHTTGAEFATQDAAVLACKKMDEKPSDASDAKGDKADKKADKKVDPAKAKKLEPKKEVKKKSDAKK